MSLDVTWWFKPVDSETAQSEVVAGLVAVAPAAVVAAAAWVGGWKLGIFNKSLVNWVCGVYLANLAPKKLFLGNQLINFQINTTDKYFCF